MVSEMDENRFLILMYHMISTPRSESEIKYACTPKLFEKHMQFIRENYNAISLDDVVNHHIQRIPLPENSVVITIDDGFELPAESAGHRWSETGVSASESMCQARGVG